MFDLYDFPLYRPPSEAYSLIIQITLGCSHNKCSFCSMYKEKKFVIKPIEDIKSDIDAFRAMYKNRSVECTCCANRNFSSSFGLYQRSFPRM